MTGQVGGAVSHPLHLVGRRGQCKTGSSGANGELSLVGEFNHQVSPPPHQVGRWGHSKTSSSGVDGRTAVHSQASHYAHPDVPFLHRVGREGHQTTSKVSGRNSPHCDLVDTQGKSLSQEKPHQSGQLSSPSWEVGLAG